MPPSVAAQEDARQTYTSPRPNSGILGHTGASEPWSPDTVLSTIATHSRYTPYSDSPVSFFHILARLKTTKREGWRRFGINHGESVADHMYRMSILTMLAPESLSSRLNIARCTKMALVHDMAESLVGDITPVDGVVKAEKSRRESVTMDYICSMLLGNVDGGKAGRELRDIWQEYEDGVTQEALFVKDIDKIELILQMVEYEKDSGGKLDLGEFTWVATRITMPEVRQWCDQVMSERRSYWQTLGTKPTSYEDASNGHSD